MVNVHEQKKLIQQRIKDARGLYIAKILSKERYQADIEILQNELEEIGKHQQSNKDYFKLIEQGNKCYEVDVNQVIADNLPQYKKHLRQELSFLYA
jgi:hypothetical protein